MDLLNYLEKNPQISKNSGFDVIKKMKYRDLLKAYFESKEFENSISQLRNKKETMMDFEDFFLLLLWIRTWNGLDDDFVGENPTAVLARTRLNADETTFWRAFPS